MSDFMKVLEGIEPKPHIPYYTMIRLEGKKYYFRPDGCRGENCCNEDKWLHKDGTFRSERDGCTCTGHWEEWDGKV